MWEEVQRRKKLHIIEAFRLGGLLIGTSILPSSLSFPHPSPYYCRWACLMLMLNVVVAQLSLQCSVTCGVGLQRRKQMCQRLTARGRRVPLSEVLCRDIPGLPLVRSCQMPACRSKYCKGYASPGCTDSAHSVLRPLFSTHQHISNLCVK